MKTKAEWLAYLREARDVDPRVMVAYGDGRRHIRFWPPAIVYSGPPKELHGQY